MTQLMGPKYVPSSEAVQISKRYKLGQPVSEYKESVAQLGCGTTILFGIGAIALIGGINSSNTSGGSSSSGTVIAIGTGALLLGLIILFTAMAKSGNRLFACIDGFVYKTSGEEKVVLWNNVEAIYQRIVEHRGRVSKYKTYNYTIKQHDGSKLSFSDNMARMEGLSNYIEASVATRLFPKVTAAYERGEDLKFGSLTVSKQGIHNGKNWLPWNDVQSVRFENGRFLVSKTGKWLDWGNFYTPSIPNFTVLEMLVDYIGRSRN
jgi:hypothetical protein